MARKLNFYPGPSALPAEALKAVQEELLEWDGTGMSVMEISHRSKEYDQLHNHTKALLKKLYQIPDDFEVVLLQGGASLQFAMVPMNILEENQSADYIVTGRFSKNAYKAGVSINKNVRLACSTEEDGKYLRIPSQQELELSSDAVYCHLTSNNTVAGTQWHEFPDTGSVPIVADMSSDIFSRKIDFSSIGLIYAGAQKNLGPAGVTVAIIRKDLIEQSKQGLPDILSYATLASKNSLYNTPPCFGIYVMNKVLSWAKNKGGLDFIENQNRQKADMVYSLIDQNPEFFKTGVEKNSRSMMNVTFRLPTEELESKFLSEAQDQGIIGLKGHRSVGGVRISMYNANGVKEVGTLIDFIKDFMKKNG
ncbi:MAG: phosphoserine transaminase [Spirochaetota bacterium]